ncbi:MAG: pyrophosphatase [Verrucomicrobia bacterium 21-51-4]|nr:MAG: pyrophosphatase [Verrucomicrobia bacterium 21-51-4]
MPEPIYIFGHKNPDPDAICAPIAYAAYKTAIGQTGYKPARCGNSNARIDMILDYFKTPLPDFIGDVTPRVQDIMATQLHTLAPESTCFRALELIDQYDIRALPVIDDNRVLKGLVSIFDLGGVFVPKPSNPRQLRHVRTSVSAITAALKAKPQHLVDPDTVQDCYVRIGSTSLDTFGKISAQESTPEPQTIVIVGDRHNIQEKALEMGARLIIITGGREPETGILELAKQSNKTSIITSPFDTSATAWIVRAAEFVEPVMKTAIFTCSPDDKLSVAKRKVAQSFAATIPVVDDHGKLVGLFTRGDLSKPVQRKIVLIDHNELSQAVDGACEVQITEVIDHHRLGNPPTGHPILFRNEPVGSSCTIVAEMFRQAGRTPDASIAGLMMSGLVTDTLNLRSPTTTARDADILAWLEPIAKITGDVLSKKIFSSGSVILSMTPDQIVRADCKAYELGDKHYAIAQVEELGLCNFWPKIESLSQALKDYCSSDHLYFAALLVTDINTQNSVLLVEGHEDFIGAIQYPKVSREGTHYPNLFDMPGVVSRKKQLTPYLTGVLESLEG